MDLNGDTILDEILAREVDEAETAYRQASKETPPTGVMGDDATPPEPSAPKDKENHSQWALGGNGKFMPVGSTAATLPSGIYEPFASPGMWGVERMNIASDGIYTLPDMATEAVLDEVNRFWASESKYRAHSLLYKRGIILWGPPGGGKTVTVKLLMNELVRRNGVVIVAQNINLTTMVLKAIRRIEPGRNLIVVLEDIDEIINFSGESAVLAMLDGENNIDNVLHLATTNYPERLGARIINRPSRFDRRVYVGMPEEPARRAYLDKATNSGLDSPTLSRWVKDTADMSIAHMRELVAAVYCLDQPYEEVIIRLSEMAKQVKAGDDFKRTGMGFKIAQGRASAQNASGG